MYSPAYLEGVACFNRRDFFNAHEAWEELWTDYHGPSRTFYQGLIQVAVCLHHFGRRNTRGARKLYISSRRYLEPYRPLHEGIDLDRLLGQMDRCCAEIASSEEHFPRGELDPHLIPTIELDPAPK